MSIEGAAYQAHIQFAESGSWNLGTRVSIDFGKSGECRCGHKVIVVVTSVSMLQSDKTDIMSRRTPSVAYWALQ